MTERWFDKEGEIEEVAVSYFDDLFTSTSPTEFEEALVEISLVIIDQMNEFLTLNATEDEVRNALFMMHLKKGTRTRHIDCIILSAVLEHS